MGDAGALLLGPADGGLHHAHRGPGRDHGGTVNGVAAHSGQTYFFFAPLFIPFFILGVPIVDMAFAFVRRTANRTGFSTPDKNHLHHRLLRLGHGHRRSVLILWAWTAAAVRVHPLPAVHLERERRHPLRGPGPRGGPLHPVPPVPAARGGPGFRGSRGAGRPRPDRGEPRARGSADGTGTGPKTGPGTVPGAGRDPTWGPDRSRPPRRRRAGHRGRAGDRPVAPHRAPAPPTPGLAGARERRDPANCERSVSHVLPPRSRRCDDAPRELQAGCHLRGPSSRADHSTGSDSRTAA